MTKRETMNGVIIAGFILALTILVSAYIPEVTIFDTDNLTINNLTVNNLVVHNLTIANVTYREDLRFPVTSIKVLGSSNLPKWNTLIDGVLALEFSPTTMEQAYAIAQMPHARTSNSLLSPHFHWTYYDEEQVWGDVVWCMEYSCANIDITFPNTNTLCVVDSSKSPLLHHMTDMINITNTLNESAICSIRIFRNATSPLDTLETGALLLEYDIHYENIFYGNTDLSG